MNILPKITLSLCLASALAGAAPTFAKPRTPAKGSSEREAIMNAMRRVVGPDFRARVVFVPEKFKVENNWAWFEGGFQFADGTRLYDLSSRALRIRYAGQKYASVPRDDLMQEFAGGGFEALLHKERGVWRVKHSAHPSDVDTSYRKRFPQAPSAIFR